MKVISALLKLQKKECDCTVLSIYVNPTQFNNPEDLNSYPRVAEEDAKIAMEIGVDILFMPDDTQIYSKESSTIVEVGGIVSDNLCGISRPGHFRGVATIVCKLFNIVQPDNAYFGLKDAQQSIIISKMVDDLNFPVEIRLMPTVREEDGLAYSSRNKDLSIETRQNALILNQALSYVKKRIVEDKIKDAMKLAGEMYEMVNRAPQTEIDYISIVSLPSLEDVKEIKGNIMVAMAVLIGKTRLIDNITLMVEEKNN